GTKFPSLFKCLSTQMNLQESQLEGILGLFSISKVAPQVVVDLTLIPLHQRFKQSAIAGAAILQQQLFVGCIVTADRCIATLKRSSHRDFHGLSPRSNLPSARSIKEISKDS